MNLFFSPAVTAALMAATIVLHGGCLPATRIIKHPAADDTGLRYYRPKPYLFITPMIDRDGMPVSGYVTIEQAVMPDFSEEYSIHVHSGLGSNQTSIKLTDGWRLDALNVEVDSQLDDNLEAVAGIAKAVPGLTSGSDAPSMAVRATNVPLGYYESVLSAGCDGKKRLHGFRYVGFLPYTPCPVESGGVQPISCHGDQIYGLTMVDGAMAFRPLHSIASSEDLRRFDLESDWPGDVILDAPNEPWADPFSAASDPDASKSDAGDVITAVHR